MLSLPYFIGTGHGSVEVYPPDVQEAQPPQSGGDDDVQERGPSGQPAEHHQVDPRGRGERFDSASERHAQGRKLHVLQLHAVARDQSMLLTIIILQPIVVNYIITTIITMIAVYNRL